MNFESQFGIGADIEFRPAYRQARSMGIEDEWLEGRITGVRFTEAKVFYDAYSPYYGEIFHNVPSQKVRKADNVVNIMSGAVVSDSRTPIE